MVIHWILRHWSLGISDGHFLSSAVTLNSVSRRLRWALKRMCDAAGARSIREFDGRFPMTQSLFNWCQDLEMALQNGGEHDPESRTARLEMAAEWLRRFPGEDGLITGNFRRALADS